jgi:hypothetical protein
MEIIDGLFGDGVEMRGRWDEDKGTVGALPVDTSAVAVIEDGRRGCTEGAV